MSGKPYEVPAEMRDLAEKSVEQARKAFDGYVGAATRAVDTLQSTQSSAQSNLTGLSQKALGYMTENVSAAFDLAQKVVRASDPREVMELQAAFMKQQMDAFQRQMQELGGSAQKVAQGMQAAATRAAETMTKPK